MSLYINFPTWVAVCKGWGCQVKGEGGSLGPVSWRSRGGLGVLEMLQKYAKCMRILGWHCLASTLSPLSHYISCFPLFTFKIGRIHYTVISHITLCCDSTAIIIAIASALCKTSSGNRRHSSKCFTSLLKSTRLLKSSAQRERKRAQVREKMWANSKTYHWPTLSGNLFMPAAKLVPQCSVHYDG